METYVAEVYVDEEELRVACADVGESVADMAVPEMMRREFGWLQDSGMTLGEIVLKRDSEKSNGLLAIDNVDLELLDDQRKRLNSALVNAGDPLPMNLRLDASQVDALQGILAMLDEWSDQRAREQEE